MRGMSVQPEVMRVSEDNPLGLDGLASSSIQDLAGNVPEKLEKLVSLTLLGAETSLSQLPGVGERLNSGRSGGPLRPSMSAVDVSEAPKSKAFVKSKPKFSPALMLVPSKAVSPPSKAN